MALGTFNEGSVAGTDTQSDDVAVAGAIVPLLAANPNRRAALVQNTGAASMRVTTDGSAPTATHGIQLLPGAALELRQPHCSTAAVKAIRETTTSTTATVTETV